MRKFYGKNALLLAFAVSMAISGGIAHATGVKTKGGIKVKSDDGNFAFQLGGRLMVDAQISDEDSRPFPSATEFRRARLFAKGTIYKDWAYKAQYDFADNNLAMKDAYIQYKGFDVGKVTIGQFKQPFSLEELTSSKYITFTERSLPNALATGRRVGLGFNSGADNYSFAASVYGQEAGGSDKQDEGVGVGARITFAPIAKKNSIVHLGLAFATEEAEETDGVSGIKISTRPEVHLGDKFSASVADASALEKTGIEAAVVMGPLSLQTEFMDATIESRPGGNDIDLEAYYVYASYFLTGQSRPYKAEKGSFGRVKPKNSGAVELGVRFSSIESDEAGVVDKLEATTVGLNYYVNPHIRFMANYVMADFSNGADEPNFVTLRAQIDF